jgi:5-methylcytosine-specific restriction endonuclease McrA
MASSALKRAVRAYAQARHCAVLWFQDINSRELFRKLGYSSIYAYASKELGFSTSKTGDFLRLARALKELPVLKREMEAGRIGYTKAREIISVAPPETEKTWVEKARKDSRKKLSEDVRQARLAAKAHPHEQPGLLPPGKTDPMPVATLKHRVSLECTGDQLARWETLWEKLHKRGAVGNRADRLLEALEQMVSTPASAEESGPSVQIHVHQCPSFQQAEIQTQRGPVPLSPSELTRLEEDAVIHQPGQRSRSSIAPAVRREVLQRDRHRCQGPGCANTRFLEIHHIIPRVQGGSHDPDNLVTLCSACHRHLHTGGASLARECPNVFRAGPGNVMFPAPTDHPCRRSRRERPDESRNVPGSDPPGHP